MTPEKMAEVLNQIDDQYLEETERMREQKKADSPENVVPVERKNKEKKIREKSKFSIKLRRLLPMAACLAIGIAAGSAITMLNGGRESSYYNDYTADEAADTCSQLAASEGSSAACKTGESSTADLGIASRANGQLSEEEGKQYASNDMDTEEDSSEYEQKLIRTYHYDFDTEDYEASMEVINSGLEKYNGYMESSQIYGEEYPTAYLVLRIPTEYVSEFLEMTGAIGDITYQSVSTEDVTLTYYDLEARIESLETQHTRLLELMEQAESIADLAELESQLSDVEYQIDSYGSQLKVYDNLIDYTTVNINLTAVEPEQTIERDGFLTRIRKGFLRNIQDVGEWMENLVIGIFCGIPYLILLAIPAAIIFLIVRIVRKCRKKKK